MLRQKIALWLPFFAAILLGCNQEQALPNGLQPDSPTWEDLVADIGPTTYSIGFLKAGKMIGVGSGFAINESTIATNAHVVLSMKKVLTDFDDPTLQPAALRNGGIVNGDGFHLLRAFATHPEYSSSTTETFDFGVVTTTKSLPYWSDFEAPKNLYDLKAGMEIGTIGFPGELNPINTLNATATFKNGTISAVRAFGGSISTPATAFYIQHNLNLSGGTSGSPIFNRSGKVIAFNNSGVETLVYSSTTDTYTRVPIASLGFGIRADQFYPTLSAPKTLFSSIKYERVAYTFINGTWSDVEILFPSLNVRDTIGWGDTLTFSGRTSESGKIPVQIKSLVATNNYLLWHDTLPLGKDFSRRYIVTSEYFLLGITNSTNRSSRSIVVSSSAEYDSTAVSIVIGGYKDVGYYKSSASTAFRMYFNSSNTFLTWQNQSTLSSNSEARYVYLNPTNILTKEIASETTKKEKSHSHRIRKLLK